MFLLISATTVFFAINPIFFWDNPTSRSCIYIVSTKLMFRPTWRRTLYIQENLNKIIKFPCWENRTHTHSDIMKPTHRTNFRNENISDVDDCIFDYQNVRLRNLYSTTYNILVLIYFNKRVINTKLDRL